MTRFAAVIFDLDGTLIDTESISIEAGVATLADLGHEVSRDFVMSLVGIDEFEGQRRLGRLLGPDADIDRIDREWRLASRRAQAIGIPLMAGVNELLSQLSARDMPRAVATNSARAAALRKLDAAGIAVHFDAAHVVGFDEVASGKPAPHVFTEAARRLGIDPARCIAFEDSDPGVAAALAAGMTVVQIPDMVPARARSAHHLAETLLEGARAAGLID